MTHDPDLLRKWLVSGPQMVRLISSFEEYYLPDADIEFRHHSEGFSFQSQYQSKVQRLIQTIKNYGNPFEIKFSELIQIDTRQCFGEAVENTLRSLKSCGEEQYSEFKSKVLQDHSTSIHTSIKKNKLHLMKTPIQKSVTKDGLKIKTLNNNVALFGQLFVTLNSRDCNMMDLFQHENQSFPPSLSDSGTLNLPKSKSDVLDCIAPNCFEDDVGFIDCKVLDGPALVHIWSPKTDKTFDEYAEKTFISNIRYLLTSCKRVDVVFDRYFKESLKSATRQKRGAGARRKVSGSTKLPGNWNDFLRDDDNKTELFQFLAMKISSSNFESNKEVNVTCEEDVLTSDSVPRMPKCSHEEADTRIIVHVKHALFNGMKNIEVRTVDTDVVVILTGHFPKLQNETNLNDIYVLFGAGKHLRRYSLKAICSRLGEDKALSLPFWVSFTGCDDTSCFRGKGKKTAWKIWLAFPEVTSAFKDICSKPFTPVTANSEVFSKLQRFVVLLYSPTSSILTVNEARMDMFCHKKQNMECLPPTENALLCHANRAVFRASIWMTADISNPDIASPENFGWKWSHSQWQPVWLTVPETSETCRILFIRCSCKGVCARCKCADANLKCTALCKCKCFPSLEE